ncbi:hypothetical protein P7228_02730 [Altererythrobacter arenosus]|uniref:ABC transporter n=1 Tax=Altererythrobacter arenosus TaxID=3032592 RepID=A0ABY8FSM4_9SPHN|nr:hypothetical protein [Altererythrobacter sp. CAU 1644]WFL78000.1 hypothetical protein P7228_02730 [Altererythrobacter sp. CAU 1644]
MATTRRKYAWLAALLALAVGLYAAWTIAARSADRQPLALMTSLPIYWGEGSDMGELIAGRVDTPFVRQVLERQYELEMLDTLAAQPGVGDEAATIDPLAGVTRLFIVQPRGLGPEDNVALDKWVRAGGKLLLALDPQLTNTYAVTISDPRHPTSAALIPPVMQRWGLAMRYDEEQTFGQRTVTVDGMDWPVVLAGELFAVGAEGDEGRGKCSIEADGVIARCSVGAGQVTVLADAAMFEQVGAEGMGEDEMLTLLRTAFD